MSTSGTLELDRVYQRNIGTTPGLPAKHWNYTGSTSGTLELHWVYQRNFGTTPCLSAELWNYIVSTSGTLELDRVYQRNFGTILCLPAEHWNYTVSTSERYNIKSALPVDLLEVSLPLGWTVVPCGWLLPLLSLSDQDYID